MKLPYIPGVALGTPLVITPATKQEYVPYATLDNNTTKVYVPGDALDIILNNLRNNGLALPVWP